MKRIAAIAVFLFLLSGSAISQQTKPVLNKQTSPSLSPVSRWEFFDLNNIACTLSNSGPFADYRRTNSSGFFWPKGSPKSAIYTAGIWLAGIHRPTGQVRTAVQDNQSEYLPGTINGVFDSAVNDTLKLADPNSERYRVYKVNAGDTMARDFREWPGDLGAPYEDRNGNGVWDAGIDRPHITGGQTLWCVYNDGRAAQHQTVAKTAPMGVEVQATYFGFNTVSFLRDVMFLRWTVINKSDAHYDSAFFGIWMDPDLGDANDDCVGIDTLRRMMYVYNASDFDKGSSGYGKAPPALGVSFLRTPQQAEPVSGASILPLYSFNPMINRLCYDCDPPPFDAYTLMKGLSLWRKPYVDPSTGSVTRYPLAGDPVTGTGWILLDSSFRGDDVRCVMSTGPMTLAPGDTQVVEAAIIIARGSDHLNSITKLRQSSDLVQEFFHDRYTTYDTPPPPPEPPPVPQYVELTQNFPNPFNPVTRIVYTVPDLGAPYPVRLEVFDVLGKKAAELVNGPVARGTYRADWNAGPLPGGVYFYRLSIGSTTVVKKMILLK